MKNVKYIVVTLMALILLMSCKTISTSTVDKSVIDKNEEIIVKTIKDSTTAETSIQLSINDSVSTIKAETTEITFTNGGGKYNTKTGEAEGVQLIKTSMREKQLQKRLEDIELLQQLYSDKMAMLQDSIIKLQQHNDVTDVRIEKDTNFWKWLIIGFICGIVIIIILKKVPYTKPLMFWL